jgi:hypothetical protein
VIIGNDVQQRIWQMMPPESIVSVTLLSRTAADAGSTSVTYNKVRRKQMNRDDMVLAQAGSEQTWMKFQFYINEESTVPKVHDRMTDDQSVSWTIMFVNIKMLGYVYDCLCLRDR